MMSPEWLREMAIRFPGPYRSVAAIERAKKRYPGVTKWSIDHSGLEPVAYPQVSSPAAEQQERLARRLREIARQEHAELGSRLAEAGGAPPRR